MNPEHEDKDLIDLGSVSIETKGLATGTDDHAVGLIKREGLSDD